MGIRVFYFYMVILLVMGGCVERKAPFAATDAQESWPDSVYISQGDKIIATTFDTLRQSLLSVIQSGGFSNAIDFCSEKAVLITSVYADSVRIRRTSQRYRNPGNRPDSLESRILKTWDREMSENQKPQSRLVRENDQIHYFKPILMQAMCLNCHGAIQRNIQPTTLTAIREQYPEDLAIDFEEGDLRGSWHLIFENN